MLKPRTNEEFVAAFWARVDKEGSIPEHVPELGPCWPWTARTDKDGYGKLKWNGVDLRAHRVAWTLAHGDIPQGKSVLHHCDNPPCANPVHLFIGTAKDNCQDALAKGRHFIGVLNGRAKLTEDNVREIRRLRVSEGTSYSRLGALFGISPPVARGIAIGKYWKRLI